MSQSNNGEPSGSRVPGATDLVLVKGFKYIVIRRAFLWAFLVLVIAIAWAIHSTLGVVDKVDEERYRSSLANCQGIADDRTQILALIDAGVANSLKTPILPSYSDDLVAAIKNSQQAAILQQEEAHRRLPIPNCKKTTSNP